MSAFKPTTVRVYLTRALEARCDPDAILAGSNVSWSQIEALKPLDLETIGSLFGYLSRNTDVCFAMKCGNACKIRDFGIVGYAMMSMPTLREAFECLNRYCLLLGHPLVTTITEEGDLWRMDFSPQWIMAEDALRFCLEASLAAVEPVIAELTELPANTRRVEFAFRQPSVTDHYGLFLTDCVVFDKPSSTYVGLRSDLDRPIRSRNWEVSDIFSQLCDRFLAELNSETTLREQLEGLMLMSKGGIPSLDEMATAMHMSRRSLQRELTLENLNYQQLIKDFRVRHAKMLLEENSLNIKSIAYQLGFRDAGSFRRAFQEWTGQTVRQWQANNKSASSRAPPGRLSARELPEVV